VQHIHGAIAFAEARDVDIADRSRVRHYFCPPRK
jgi:hypothetical protein